VPFDWHEIIAGIAPRPYFNWATLNDRIFPNTENFSEVYQQVGDVYAFYGKRENFIGKLSPGGHLIPAEVRQEAYAWIQAQFKINNP